MGERKGEEEAVGEEEEVEEEATAVIVNRILTKEFGDRKLA